MEQARIDTWKTCWEWAQVSCVVSLSSLNHIFSASSSLPRDGQSACGTSPHLQPLKTMAIVPFISMTAVWKASQMWERQNINDPRGPVLEPGEECLSARMTQLVQVQSVDLDNHLNCVAPKSAPAKSPSYNIKRPTFPLNHCLHSCI